MSRPIQKEPSDDEEEEEEDNNPFADRNEVTTPKVEREEHGW
jgi:LAS seventeen-binding protein 5